MEGDTFPKSKLFAVFYVKKNSEDLLGLIQF